jgi:hypothetical protein
MENQLTIIQNFILNDQRYNHLKSDLGLEATAEVLGDCKFVVNYKSEKYVNEVKSLYKKYFKNLLFYNNIEDEKFTWASSTKNLMGDVNTPYIFYLTEDRMFHNTTKKEFTSIMDEVVKNDIWWMSIGKLWKYSLTTDPLECQNKRFKFRWDCPPYMDNDKHIYTFYSKQDPHNVVSIDSIFNTELFHICLDRLKNNPSKRPHVLEEGYISPDIAHNWIKRDFPDKLCAVPKKPVVVSDDDPGYSLKNSISTVGLFK